MHSYWPYRVQRQKHPWSFWVQQDKEVTIEKARTTVMGFVISDKKKSMKKKNGLILIILRIQQK